MEEKDLTYEVVQDYLAEHDPHEAEDLDLVFDPVYAAVAQRSEPSAGEAREGIGFDANLLAGTAITIATQVALELVKAALRDAMDRDGPRLLDKVEGQLIEWTGKAKLVAALRDRVERILKKL
jgi:Arc/MetJ family transcription regulator